MDVLARYLFWFLMTFVGACTFGSTVCGLQALWSSGREGFCAGRLFKQRPRKGTDCGALVCIAALLHAFSIFGSLLQGGQVADSAIQVDLVYQVMLVRPVSCLCSFWASAAKADCKENVVAVLSSDDEFSLDSWKYASAECTSYKRIQRNLRLRVPWQGPMACFLDLERRCGCQLAGAPKAPQDSLLCYGAAQVPIFGWDEGADPLVSYTQSVKNQVMGLNPLQASKQGLPNPGGPKRKLDDP